MSISLAKRANDVLSSRKFFWGVVALLVLQALWIACSGLYPMAFDEDFHLGIIRLYAHHPYPFWARQPYHATVFGAVARDPSYLYHYLMSFPYHLLTLITKSVMAQVLVLRLMNIGFFAGGLVLYRRLLLKTGASAALTHLCLLLFVLLPVVPLLAGEINYDNALLPLTALCLLLTLKLYDQLTKHRPEATRTLLQLLIACMLTSLVQYSFLPLFIGIVGFVLVTLIRLRLANRQECPSRLLLQGFKGLSRASRVGLVALFVLSLGLFAQRYGVNVVRYHTPVPDCAQVLNVKRCSHYGPWIRDYTYAMTKTDSAHGPVIFMYEWLRGMWLRVFFAVDGPTTNFQTRGPLTVPALGAIVITLVANLALALRARKVWRRYSSPALWLFVVTAVVYMAALWVQRYRAYVYTSVPVGINGRYLLPILPPMMIIGALAVDELAKRRQALKVGLATASIICLLWGGGALTYILRSNDAWYWHSSVVRTANHAVQRLLGPLTPGYNHPTQYL